MPRPAKPRPASRLIWTDGHGDAAGGAPVVVRHEEEPLSQAVRRPRPLPHHACTRHGPGRRQRQLPRPVAGAHHQDVLQRLVPGVAQADGEPRERASRLQRGRTPPLSSLYVKHVYQLMCNVLMLLLAIIYVSTDNM